MYAFARAIGTFISRRLPHHTTHWVCDLAIGGAFGFLASPLLQMLSRAIHHNTALQRYEDSLRHNMTPADSNIALLLLHYLNTLDLRILSLALFTILVAIRVDAARATIRGLSYFFGIQCYTAVLCLFRGAAVRPLPYYVLFYACPVLVVLAIITTITRWLTFRIIPRGLLAIRGAIASAASRRSVFVPRWPEVAFFLVACLSLFIGCRYLATKTLVERREFLDVHLLELVGPVVAHNEPVLTYLVNYGSTSTDIDMEIDAGSGRVPCGLVIGGRTFGDAQSLKWKGKVTTSGRLDVVIGSKSRQTTEESIKRATMYVLYSSNRDTVSWYDPGDTALLLLCDREQVEFLLNEHAPDLHYFGYRMRVKVEMPCKRSIWERMFPVLRRIRVLSQTYTHVVSWPSFKEIRALQLEEEGNRNGEGLLLDLDSIGTTLHLQTSAVITEPAGEWFVEKPGAGSWVAFGQNLRYSGAGRSIAVVRCETRGWSWMPYLAFPIAVGAGREAFRRYRRRWTLLIAMKRTGATRGHSDRE